MRAARNAQTRTIDRGAKMIVCTYDNRKEAEPGIRLLIASLYRQSPRLPLILCYPAADDQFRAWARNYPNVSLENNLVPGHLGWDVKPQMLLRMLQRGHEEVIWIDTDIVITRAIEPVFDGLSPDALVVTEEALWGRHSDFDAIRARGWGFDVARVLPFCLNTGVVRVTAHHRGLLETWKSLLDSPEYLEAQRKYILDRPIHLIGDQDVLTALLCRRDFADVELKILRRGSDILQIFGMKAFTTRERFKVLRHGLPPFVHAQQFKPWNSSGRFSTLQAAYLDTSPYTHVASQYRADLGENSDWLKPQNPIGQILLALGFANPALAGMPIALGVDVAFPIGKRLKSVVRKLKPSR